MGSLNTQETVQAGPYDRYRWRQTTNGQWYREADEVEKFYATFSRKRDDPEKAGFPITASAFFQVSAPDSVHHSPLETILRQAWTILRSECPTLASWIQFDKETETWRRVYNSLSSAGNAQDALDTWTSSTFLTVKTSMSPSEWLNTNPPTPRSPVLYLVLPEDASQNNTGAVFLRSPHDLIDGLGLLQLIDRLFEIASDLYQCKQFSSIDRTAADSEIKLLAPPMPVATGMAPKLSPDQQKRYDAVKVEAIMNQMKMPQLGLPIDMTKLSPGATGGSKRVAAVLPPSSSERLLASCKEHGLTPTHVLSAGLVLALRDWQTRDGDEEEPKTLRYHAQALVNLRGFFDKEAIPSSVAMAAGNHHMLATTGFLRDFVIDAKRKADEGNGEEFMSVAQQFRDYYTSVRPSTDSNNETGRDHLDFTPHTWDMYTPKPPPAPPAQQEPSQPPAGESQPPSETSAPPPEPPKLPTSAPVAVSAIGNISSVVKADRRPFKVTSAWIAAEGLGPSIPVLIQTWEGQVGVSACYEGMFHKGEDVERFLRDMLKGTLRGLGLAESAAEEDFLSEW